MKKIQLLVTTDILAALSFYLLLLTGLMLEFLFPKGSGNKVKVMELGRHDWGDLHLIIGYVFISLIALHLILHWKWIFEVLVRRFVGNDKSKTKIILISLAILLVLMSPGLLFV
jgi:hypothetical protein